MNTRLKIVATVLLLLFGSNPVLAQERNDRRELPANPSATGFEPEGLAREAEIAGDFVMIVRKDRSIPGRIAVTREVVSLDEFAERFGLLLDESNGKHASPTTQDAGEQGIPTPPEPPSDIGWEPGDVVIYTRYGNIDGQWARRTTQYRYTGGGGSSGGDWTRERNIVEYCDADFTDCNPQPQPKPGF